MPRSLDEVYGMTKADVMAESALARNEVERVKEFARLALNPVEAFILIDEIVEAYHLDENEEKDGVTDGFNEW